MNKTILVLIILAMFQSVKVMAAPTSDVLVVLLGGYDSCGSSDPAPSSQAMYPYFSSMLKDLQTKYPSRNFHYVVSCFNLDAPPDGNAQYITSENASVATSGTIDEIQTQVERIAGTHNSLPTFVIGHSYGGWSAMYLGQNMKLSHALDGLFTIDPISPQCDAGGVIFGSDACHEAPTDLDNATIKKQAVQWTNFYEDEGTWLSSSAIPEASTNKHMQYHMPHDEIDVDPNVWSQISTAIQAAL